MEKEPGGTVAARASLQKPYNDQIMNPRQLFDWATINIPTIHFDYCSSDDYETEKKNVEQQFLKARTIPRHVSSIHLSLSQRKSS